MESDAPIDVGDRVVHLQVPGVCTVVGRRGAWLEIESARGLRFTVHEVGVRRVTSPSAAAPETR